MLNKTNLYKKLYFYNNNHNFGMFVMISVKLSTFSAFRQYLIFIQNKHFLMPRRTTGQIH